MAELFKLQVGDWRVVLSRYEEERRPVVHVVAHRRKVCRAARRRLER